MGKSLWFILTAILGLEGCGAYKILVVFPFPGTSHSILGDGIVRHLLSAGHEVTLITPFPKEKTQSNLRIIDVSSIKKQFPNVLNLKRLLDKEVDLNDFNFVFQMMLNVSDNALQHKNVRSLLEDPKEHFDLVIPEWMFVEVYCGIAVVFNCPCVFFFPVDYPMGSLSLIDELPNSALTPGIFTKEQPPFDFKGRVTSLIFHIVAYLTKQFKHVPIESDVYERGLRSIVNRRGMSLPTYEEMRHNVSLILCNSHVSLGSVGKFPMNMINIGGFHIDTNLKPLPADLQRLMDEAKHGVIYFSLGSNLKSKEFPDVMKKELLEMFGGLQQTVLWKFEDKLSNLPKNVHILEWAPQTSILAHPNCVLFITHGGFLSTTETVHFGVPIIGVPVFADQFQNVDKAVASGYARRVDMTYSLAKDLQVAIEEVLRDPSLSQRVKELSTLYHDRPVSPGAELVHWVEHVIKTRGAPHLRSIAFMVPWYQKMYLDLLALTIATLVLIRISIKRLLSYRKKKQPVINVKSKKNNKNNKKNK